MKNRFLVVDDFYSNPDELVETALASLKVSEAGNYAGVMTQGSFLSESVRKTFCALLNERNIDSATNANGRIRFTRQQDRFKQHIHFDGGVHTSWAGVVYLSKNHPDVDGTTFWRHTRTGLEEIPRSVEALSNQGWNTNRDLQNFLESEGVDESLWQRTFSVPYKYNRLVLFRPWLFHAPGASFGESLDSARAVQTLFLRA